MKYFLEHPNHGKKIAYLQKEYEGDKKEGWKKITEEKYYFRPEKPEKKVKE